MLTLEMAIQKIQQLPTEQRNQVIQFIEFLDFQSNRATAADSQAPQSNSKEAFFELAGLWENKEITADSLRAEAWGDKNAFSTATRSF